MIVIYYYCFVFDKIFFCFLGNFGFNGNLGRVGLKGEFGFNGILLRVK